jgi:hypothetical protein
MLGVSNHRIEQMFEAYATAMNFGDYAVLSELFAYPWVFVCGEQQTVVADPSHCQDGHKVMREKLLLNEGEAISLRVNRTLSVSDNNQMVSLTWAALDQDGQHSDRFDMSCLVMKLENEDKIMSIAVDAETDMIFELSNVV